MLTATAYAHRAACEYWAAAPITLVCTLLRMGNAGPAAMGGHMRKLIVSSLVSLDGIYGDPQSWAGDYAPAR